MNKFLSRSAVVLVSAGMIFSSSAAVSPVSAEAATKTTTQKVAAKKKTVKLGKNTVYIPRVKNKTTINTKYGSVRRGALTVPKNTQWVRWQSGPKLSDKKGTIVLSSHINWGKARGPLYNHSKMKKGDIIYVSDERGKVRKFKMVNKAMIKKNKLPKQIFTKKGANRLVMVTCGGKLLKTKKGSSYDSNVIIYLVPTK